jgi:hypothetical protein
MRVVSVINYKGGVGKTTLTANLGAELAWRGYRVLLLDLDAQASLTFAFVRPDYWEKHLENGKTIKSWYDAVQSGNRFELASLVLEPADVKRWLKSKPPLQLITSHLGLINVDLELATGLAGATLTQAKLNYMKVQGCVVSSGRRRATFSARWRPPYAAATLRATSKSSSGIGTGSRHVNSTGRSPRWSTYVTGPRNVNGCVPSSDRFLSRTNSRMLPPRC